MHNKNNAIPPEHPRSSTTDDVECFFSVLCDTVGKDFTLKQVYVYGTSKFTLSWLLMQVFYGWRKVTHEFLKRLDPDLPFYYHTSTHSRFYEGSMPDFDTKPRKKPKQKRIPRYEILGANERVSVAVRGTKTVRTKFHNMPVDLPSPPGMNDVLLHEHTYARHSYK